MYTHESHYDLIVSGIVESPCRIALPVAKGLLFAAAVLALASAGPLIGHGWIGHGLYKAALLFLPFLAGRRFFTPGSLSRHALGVSLGSGLLLGIAAFSLVAAFLPDPAGLRANFDARYHYTPRTAALAALLIMSVNALLEEWFYRGCLDDLLGPLVSSFVFGAQHFIVLRGLAGDRLALAAAAAVIPAGLLWSLLMKRHGLAAASLSHAAADLVLLGGGLYYLGWLG